MCQLFALVFILINFTFFYFLVFIPQICMDFTLSKKLTTETKS